ncbi:hypothetical protein ACH40D_33155 [Streptomyces olivaceoviridis]|uniref:Uncharacterized protein n=1 Tax=Streptomyces olivaceoviridis TaxID=1921 RepID=A0ABW7VEJ5_STROI|nr:hypothetical protein [Streptomyces corchorusii]
MAAHETELLVDGKVVGYQGARAGHRRPVALTAELPGDPPQPFGVTVHAGDAAVCVLEIAGRRQPMPEVPLGRGDGPRPGVDRPALRRIRRLLRHTLPRRARRR